MGSDTADRTPPGGKAIAVALAVLIGLPVLAMISGLFIWVALSVWQAIFEML